MAGYRQVLVGFGRHDEEDAPGWSTLVELSGGMQIARAEAKHGGDSRAAADLSTEVPERVGIGHISR